MHEEYPMNLTLNPLAELLKVDRSGMLQLVEQAPARARIHYQRGLKHRLQLDSWQPQQILVCGMGGSGSTGDLLQALCPQSQIPILVNKSALLPAWVNTRTLVIGVSYSGQTEETLRCLEQAQQAGAHLHLLSSGGAMAAFAERQALSYVPLEGGLPPRSALLDMLFALLGSVQHLNFLGLDPALVHQSLDFLEDLNPRFAPGSAAEPGLVVQLARSLQRQKPLLWASDTATALIAQRWKNQLSENAKVLATWAQLPELNHNEMVAMCASHHSQTALFYLTLSSDVPGFDQVSLDLVQPHVASLTRLFAQGRSHLEKVLYLTSLGDFVSVWLALLNQTDPTPIEPINEFKRRIALT